MSKLRETGRTGVMRACLDLLAAEGIRHWRMNAGKTIIRGANGKYRCIMGHEKGTPDILMSWRDFGCLEAHLVWLECKATGKKLTPEQVEFRNEAFKNGERMLVISDPQELIDWIKQNKVKPISR